MEWMLPSKTRPTISPLALIRGLPELPPTMSLLVERLKRVERSSLSLAFAQLGGTAKGASPVARSKKRERVVNGATFVPFSVQPCTEP